jgi:hypothetical protein
MPLAVADTARTPPSYTCHLMHSNLSSHVFQLAYKRYPFYNVKPSTFLSPHYAAHAIANLSRPHLVGPLNESLNHHSPTAPAPREPLLHSLQHAPNLLLLFRRPSPFRYRSAGTTLSVFARHGRLHHLHCFRSMRQSCRVPRLWGLSFLGTRLRVYFCDIALNHVTPNVTSRPSRYRCLPPGMEH